VTGALRLLPAGSRGLLAEVGGPDDVLRLHAALRARTPPGVVDLVPAARTVLVVHDPRRTTRAAVARAVEAAWAGSGTAPGPAAPGHPAVEVPVRYDGADLHTAAGHLDLTVDELIATHTGTTWRVAFCGFAPGFPYCVATDGPATGWQVPRRPEPRTRVPAGAVALAGGWTGVYPTASPGGWQLVGTT
jgi:KipI family sensor histidine kinase inhibitor